MIARGPARGLGATDRWRRGVSVTAFAALLAAFVAAYGQVMTDLFQDWLQDDNYSHGLVVLPLAAYLIWQRRERFTAAAVRPTVWGLVLVLVSLVQLTVGLLGAEFFISRVAILVTVVGTILFLYGWGHVRLLAFPLALFLLAIPLPALIFNQIAFPLQLLASRVGVVAMSLFDVPVLREGNVIVLANATLEVAEACSGIRSLASLLTLSMVYSYFAEPGTGHRVLLVSATIPIAVAVNGVRVAGTGLMANRFGPESADGFFHGFSGWLMFIAAFALLLGWHYVLRWASGPHQTRIAQTESPSATK